MSEKPLFYSAGQVPRTLAVQAIVFYDPHDGRIRHMHHAITLEGGRILDGPALEHEALQYVKQIGVDVAGLRALHVENLPEPGGRFRVDVKSQKLVALEIPREIRTFKAGRVPA